MQVLTFPTRKIEKCQIPNKKYGRKQDLSRKVKKINWVLSRNEQIPNRKNRNLCKKNRKFIGFVARQTGFSVGKIGN